MTKTYILNYKISLDFRTNIYEWVETKEYKKEDYVLIVKNNQPYEILIPELVQDMSAYWYEHKRIKLNRFKWRELWDGVTNV